MKTKTITALRQVRIDIGGQDVVAWEPKEPSLRSLGRWTDPKDLLHRMYELEHPEANVPEGPGRQWQATWRGRFSPARRGKKLEIRRFEGTEERVSEPRRRRSGYAFRIHS